MTRTLSPLMSTTPPPTVPAEFRVAELHLRDWLATEREGKQLLPTFELVQGSVLKDLFDLLRRAGWADEARDFEKQVGALHDAIASRANAEAAGEGYESVADLWGHVEDLSRGTAAWIHRAATDFQRARLAPPQPPAPVLTPVMFNLDLQTGKVTFTDGINRVETKLPIDTAFEIVYFLASHPEHRFMADEIIDALWPVNSTVSAHAVDVHLSDFRAALEAKGGLWVREAKRIKSRNKRKFIDLSAGNDED